MRILIADKFQSFAVKQLEESGHTVSQQPSLSAEDLPAAIAGYDALIVRSTKVNKATIEAADQLSLIVRAGAGTNTIDTVAAAAAGVYVCNTPGQNAVAVAELALALLLAIDRRVADNVIALRRGEWNKKEFSKAEGLFGRSVAILGLGDIGMAFAERARAMGLKVLGVKKARSAAAEARLAKAGVELCEDQRQLLRRADIVSIHLPANAQTKGLVNAEFLADMKQGAVLLNTSRGNLVDDEALLAAIESKGLWVGLDVYNDEPTSGSGEFSNALTQHPRVYGTHHIGASTEQAQNAIATAVVDLIESYDRGEVKNAVNMEQSPAVSHSISIRHRDKVGVLAAVLHALKEDDVNIEHMDNRVFAGAVSACATLQVNRAPGAAVLATIQAHADVIQVQVKEL